MADSLYLGMKTPAVILFVCTLCFAQAQQLPIPIYQSENFATPFINEEGKTVFILPKGHEPVTHLTSLFKKPPVYKNLDAFPSGICVIRGPGHNYYWINPSGKVLKDFSSAYHRMSPFSDGFLVCMKTDQNGNQSFNYLNTTGTLLSASGFKVAQPFNEGLAACVTTKNEYVYIDKSGKVVIELFKGMNVQYAELGQFINGLAPIKAIIGNVYIDHFIDMKGKLAIDLNVVFQGRNIERVGCFFDTMAGVLLKRKEGTGQDLAFIDRAGVVKLTYPKVVGFNDFVGGLGCVHREILTQEKMIGTHTMLIDTLGKEIQIQAKPDTYITAITPHYIVAKVYDKTQKTLFFSRVDNAFIYETEGEIAGMTGDFVLMHIGDYNPIQHLIKLPDTIVWTPQPEHIVYDNLINALKVKDQVRNLNLNIGQNLTASVYSLTKLENLEISFQEITAFPPGISKLTNLERLRLFHLEMLTALPTELTQLKKIRTIEIINCPRLKNLEAVIEKCTSLKKVYAENYTFKQGFIENMKKLRPDLDIEAITKIELGEFPK